MKATAKTRRLRLQNVGQDGCGCPIYCWSLVSGNGKTICFGNEVCGKQRAINSANAFARLLKDKPKWARAAEAEEEDDAAQRIAKV